MQGHHAVLINSPEEARSIIKDIGVDDGAFDYLLPKALYRCIKLKQVPCRAALIIKQEMLSKGGEAAVSRNTISGEGFTDVLLMGNLKQYRLLLEKLKLQPFGLKKLALGIQDILNSLVKPHKTLALSNGRNLDIGTRTLIMGILNITPDSFSDGGKFFDRDRAIERAREMIDQGADIIDVGGASSRLGADLPGESEELKRVLPVVEKLAGEGMIISIDTFRGSVAQACLQAGAEIINDIGRLELDPALLPVLAEKQVPVILMHNRLQFDRDKPYEDLVSDIMADLKQSIERAQAAGLQENKIIVDPGIGFGKTPGQSRLLIKRLWEFKSLGCPVLVGASRKSFIGHTLGLEVDQRLEGSLAAATMSIMNGADIIRVHDVKESRRVALMTEAVMRENG